MSEALKIRTKKIPLDTQREPKTSSYCEMCRRDLKDGQPHREVRWELDTYAAIHGNDWELAEQSIARPIDRGLLGLDCAKKLGLEFSRPA